MDEVDEAKGRTGKRRMNRRKRGKRSVGRGK